MENSLQHEIRQSVPFANLHEELWLNLSRTAAAVSHAFESRLRPFGVSATQYNVLRILRGAGQQGLPQFEVRERLVARVPDVPRILDRMEKAGWVARRRDEVDRRMVVTVLTADGLRLVDALEEPLKEIELSLFPMMDVEQMKTMNELLTVARCTHPVEEGGSVEDC